MTFFDKEIGYDKDVPERKEERTMRDRTWLYWEIRKERICLNEAAALGIANNAPEVLRHSRRLDALIDEFYQLEK